MINWDALGALAELAGAVAVVLTLAYLARQISQNTKMMRAQAYQARSDTLMDLTMRVAESAALSSIQERVVDFTDGGFSINEDGVASLNPTELSQYRNYLTAHVHRMDNLLKQYELGYLDDDYFEWGIVGSAERFWIPMWKRFGVVLAEPLIQKLSSHIDDT